jgi:glutaryl-CoA dehydrogenase
VKPWCAARRAVSPTWLRHSHAETQTPLADNRGARFGHERGGAQQKLADKTLEDDKGYLLVLHLGPRKDAGGLSGTQVSLSKLNNVRQALAIARTTRTILGASGITPEYPAMRHANNLESVCTYEGTSEMHT